MIITRHDVKSRSGISSAEHRFDYEIDDIIIRFQQVIEYEIKDEYLKNVNDLRLQAVLKLGVVEVIAAEVAKSQNMSDRSIVLRESGEKRLKPFLKSTTIKDIADTSVDLLQKKYDTAVSILVAQSENAEHPQTKEEVENFILEVLNVRNTNS